MLHICNTIYEIYNHMDVKVFNKLFHTQKRSSIRSHLVLMICKTLNAWARENPHFMLCIDKNILFLNQFLHVSAGLVLFIFFFQFQRMFSNFY